MVWSSFKNYPSSARQRRREVLLSKPIIPEKRATLTPRLSCLTGLLLLIFQRAADLALGVPGLKHGALVVGFAPAYGGDAHL